MSNRSHQQIDPFQTPKSPFHFRRKTRCGATRDWRMAVCRSGRVGAGNDGGSGDPHTM